MLLLLLFYLIASRYTKLPSLTPQAMILRLSPSCPNVASVAFSSCRWFQSAPSNYSGLTNMFLAKPIWSSSNSTILTNMLANQQNRSIVIYSKKKKRKTVKAVVKRFKMLGSGKIKRWKCGRRHLALSKSKKTRRHLRKPTFCTSKQAKLLKKMVNQKKWR